MKKRLILGLACTLMLGVSGCMGEGNSKVEIKQGSIEDVSKKDSELIQNMLSYVNEKYDEDFEAYKFFPSLKGLTTHMSKSALLAENKEGMKIVIFQRNNAPGDYLENYKQTVLAQYAKDELESFKQFDGEFSVSIISSVMDDLTLEEIESNVIGLMGEVTSLQVSAYTEEEFTEENLMKLYEFYMNIKKYEGDEKNIFFTAASTINKEMTKEFIEYMYYYEDKYLWQEFDSAISEILWVEDRGDITFEQFKSYLKNNK